MTLPAADSGNGTMVANPMAHDDNVATAPTAGLGDGSGIKVLKRTLSYKDDEDDVEGGGGKSEVDESETMSKKLKCEAEDKPVIGNQDDSNDNLEQTKEEMKVKTNEEEEEDEQLDYETQRQRNILENQRILAELGLDNGPIAAGPMLFSSRANFPRPPSSSYHGVKHRAYRRGAKKEVGSDDEFVDQDEDDEDGREDERRRRPTTGSSTKLKLLQDAKPVQLRQSRRLRGFKAPEPDTTALSDHTDGEEDLTDNSDNETGKSKKSKKNSRKTYEDKQWKTRNNGVQDVLPSEQKLAARSAWRGRKQLTGFMVELELPNNISTPLTLRSIATTIWDVGKIYDGKTKKLSYWSSNGSLYKHPYPIGFKAEKQYFRSTFAMEIQATPDSGPEFTVRNMSNGQTFRGASPTQPWTLACLASHSKGTRISGPLFFGFSDPLLQKMIEGLDGYQRWSTICAEVEREKLGLPPLLPSVPTTEDDASIEQAKENTKEHSKEQQDIAVSMLPIPKSAPSDEVSHEGASKDISALSESSDPPSVEAISKSKEE